MTDFSYLMILGISAFVSTNIDDIFLLIVFFSNSLKFPKYQVVIGQYIGIGLLITISIIASLISLVIPSFLIGFMGIIQIIIGIKKLIEYYKKKKERDTTSKNTLTRTPNSSLSFLSVAAVTFSNGGDNIGIYTPLFANKNTIDQIVILVVIFIIMTAVWCSIGYYLVNHSFLANRIWRIGHLILPFVLIGLGIYIMVGEFTK
ncbi:MAG TPA: cadmium resistance transporter [Nitrososphaeraceae archaeon]|nr:cadmium resistance transporter [Nitrososphaeraceae archaeon]